MTVVKIKKQKSQKKCIIKRKIKFENCKNCLEATQLENKIKYLEKNKTNVGILKRNHKEFIRKNKSILRTQQRFKSRRHNVFTEEFFMISFKFIYVDFIFF